MVFRAAGGRGVGLGGILVICLLLYFSGAGTWLWERVKQLDASCYAMMGEVRFPQGNPICAAMAKGITRLGLMGESIRHNMHDWWSDTSSRAGINVNKFGDVADQMRVRLSGFGSASDKLNSMIRQGPRMVRATDVREQFQQAIDSFAIGQNYLKNGSTQEAIQWLRQGASQPGYGLQSQLSLGDMYMHGTHGVTVDQAQAQYYYQQAYDSLQLLRTSHTPQAEQLKQALPNSLETVQVQLNGVIANLQAGGR